MKNVNDLRKSLIGVFEDVKAGKMEIQQAKTLNGTAAQIISTAKTELQYRKLRGSTAKIAFLD